MKTSSSSQVSSSPRTLSGSLAGALAILAQRLVIASVHSSSGALRRATIVPVLLLIASGLRWWSRSYVGRKLGFGWSRQTYAAGHDKLLSPAEVGESWQQFRNGNVLMKAPAAAGKRKRP